jgi:hypothetical protein
MAMRTGADDANGMAAMELVATVVSTEDLRVARFIDRETPGNVGVALSGGGSRAATAAMGQLRALHELGLLDRVRAISGVSGGGWLSAAWTFLPQDRSDAEFFGPYVADPGVLTIVPDDHAPPGAYLREVAETCFAHPITRHRFDTVSVAAGLLGLRPRGVSGARAWQTLVGELLYAPLGLFEAWPDGRPKTFFAFDEAAVQVAREANPSLPAVAHTVKQAGPGEARRPFFICNAGLEVLDERGERAIAPVQATPFFVGVVSDPPARDHHGHPVGGGAVTPFAFGGRLVDRRGELITVRSEAAFALSDIVGTGSAFYADFLDDRDVETIVPAYPYFHPTAECPAGAPCRFVDGGCLENQGVAALLAYRDIDSIIVFSNTSTALSRSKDGLDLVVIDDAIPPLFGYQPYREGIGYLSQDPEAPSIPPGASGEGRGALPDFRHDRVFPESAFPALLEGLWAATTAGGAVPGVGPCTWLQRGLPVQENRWFGTHPRTIDVLWFYLNPASQWTDRLSRTVAKLVPYRWPNYPTADTGLSAPAVNYLAHFASWVVVQRERDLRALFGGR